MKNINKYSAVVINITYQLTKKVVILINLLSGVLIVKGDHYADWIAEEFPNLGHETSTHADEEKSCKPEVTISSNTENETK